MNVRLRSKDLKILRFINQFGICEVPQLCYYFGFKKPYVYEFMQRLIRGGLVKHDMIYHQRSGVYWLTRQGATHTDLPALKKIPTDIYRHELLQVELYFALKQRYPEMIWVSERELVNEKFKDGLGQRGHIADGVMILPDQKKIAIELELTVKSKRRLTSILKQYAAQFEYDEVWYFCTEKVAKALVPATEHYPFIQIKLLKDYLRADPRCIGFLDYCINYNQLMDI